MTEIPNGGELASANTKQTLDSIDAALREAGYASPDQDEGLSAIEARQPNALKRAGAAVVRFAARIVSPTAREQHRTENHQAGIAAQAEIEVARTSGTIGAVQGPEVRPLFQAPPSEEWGQKHVN